MDLVIHTWTSVWVTSDMIFVHTRILSTPGFSSTNFTPENGVICDIVHSRLNSVNAYISLIWAFLVRNGIVKQFLVKKNESMSELRISVLFM